MSRYLLFSLLAAALLLACLLSLAIGAVAIAPADVLRVLWPWAEVTGVAPGEQLIVEQIRLPRALMGAMTGATLALTGAAMQGLFRNPLADPGLIGVSGGAALGAALAIVFGVGLAELLPRVLSPYLTVSGAFVGGVVSTIVVYRLGQALQGGAMSSMLLAGVAITTLSGALIGLLGYLADSSMLRTLTFWNMGTLAHASYERVIMLALCCALVWWRLPRRARELNALLLGESEAHHLGLDVARLKLELIILTALGVAASVAAAGLIGFVGLMVPHLARLMVGPDHRPLLPASMLLGATLMLLADIAARLLMAPAELPIGILTAALGAPFFLVLLYRMRTGVTHA
ncbi:iron ABC transporter permease [Halopseudomonas nanhaiensis]|uniref:FecCD family ABC transporter permease n=1 Tax=Halopseudomonas nanhaiensis TaxID=2830842 RepID=UPI001CC0CCC4|nr:iron ABC transporter permease [Halopseudomonas nanhaiensis]UAW97951.1 iron ABC transporter permease [Halopseudomonas nanhaiensis]